MLGKNHVLSSANVNAAICQSKETSLLGIAETGPIREVTGMASEIDSASWLMSRLRGSIASLEAIYSIFRSNAIIGSSGRPAMEEIRRAISRG